MASSYVLIIKAISAILAFPVLLTITEDSKETDSSPGGTLIISIFLESLALVPLLFFGFFIYSSSRTYSRTYKSCDRPGGGFDPCPSNYDINGFIGLIVDFFKWIPFEISLLIIAAAFLSLVLSTEGFAR